MEIDNDALLEKYSFLYDYAPQMWLGEDDDGWWPGELSTFFDNMEGNPQDYKLSLQTRTPMTAPYGHDHEFFHGERPHDGKSVPIMTFILPVSADQQTEMEPLEMLLNPEDTTIEASYIYFFPFDSVPFGLGNHVADLEKTKVIFKNGEPTKVRASYHDWEHIRDYSDV